MDARRPGYSIVEMIIALSIGTLLVGGMYQALVVQERGYETTGAVVEEQDALRTALAILEGEFREMAAVGGSAVGGTDILYAGEGSIQIRAPRKLGAVCSVWPSDRAVVVWAEGALFESGDGFMVFVDDDVTTYRDDSWAAAEVINTNDNDDDCPSSPSGIADQRVQLDANILRGVWPGAPVRGYERVSYRIHALPEGGWSLARLDADSTVHFLVRGLAEPGQGMRLEYFDEDRVATTDPTDVASIRITLRTDPADYRDIEATQISSTVYLRNN